jgi:nucleoside 2-deoxyribosyltransferase
VLVTFSVLVGVSLADFFDETKNRLPGDVHDWAFFVVVALLLRYIIGSVIHLKHAYRGAPDFQHSASIRLFLKDIGFLVAFGLVAVKITHSVKLFHFWQQSWVFISISLVWSITDPIFRKIWEPGALQQEPLWRVWTVIDAAQLSATLLIYFLIYSYNQYLATIVLAVIYGIFFFLDLAALLRIMALRKPTVVTGMPRGTIYLAGPLFNVAEQSFNRNLADTLEQAGYSVFLPQAGEQQTASSEDIYKCNMQALKDAALVVANMDGPDPDSGTCFECGYSVGTGKPVIVFRTDFRANDEPNKAPYNLMLERSATVRLYHPFARPDEIFREIIRVLPEPVGP